MFGGAGDDVLKIETGDDKVHGGAGDDESMVEPETMW